MVNASSINPNMSFRAQMPQDMQFLEQKLEGIEDKQGILGSIWNGVKEVTTLGVSQSDCESMLEKYKNGEISFEEAVNYLDEFDSKQENVSSLLSNILTGIGAIALATPIAQGGAITWALAAKIGAPIGAALKTSINIIDRATNDIEGDALDGKQIAKDAISGAITGTTSAVSSGVAKGFKTFKEAGNIGVSIGKGVECGLKCGSLAGSTTYLTNVAFGDEEFSVEELLADTATSALVSGSVGGVVGAGLYGINNLTLNNTAQSASRVAQEVGKQDFTSQIIKDSTSSSARKIGGTKVRQVFGI